VESGETFLYLHAPQQLSRDESFAYHVTTRNFFAWLMGVPIVGYDPVSALLALKDRMDIWRDEGSDNLKAICDYIHEQGYGDMSQIEAQLSPAPAPTMYRNQSARYENAPTLNSVPNRSSSVAIARQKLRRKKRFSETFHQRPHIADLVRPQKKDALSIRIPLREGELATIAYEDTVAGNPPSLTAWQPKRVHTRSIGRDCNYTEIVIPDYGNGLDNIPSSPETATTNISNTPTPTSAISQASPSDAYTRLISQDLSDDTAPPPSPSSTSSRHSNVPSLSSTYSTEAADSPLPTSPALTNYPFNHDTETQHIINAGLDPARGKGLTTTPQIEIATGSEPDLIIDALIGELEGAGKPRYDEDLAMDKYPSPRQETGLAVGVGLA
jgi:hypothetical protein